MNVGFKYSQNKCSWVRALPWRYNIKLHSSTNSFLPVNLNLYPWETEVRKFSFSNLSSKFILFILYYTLLILLILLKSELFCSFQLCCRTFILKNTFQWLLQRVVRKFILTHYSSVLLFCNPKGFLMFSEGINSNTGR